MFTKKNIRKAYLIMHSEGIMQRAPISFNKESFPICYKVDFGKEKLAVIDPSISQKF
jgi:hypothetical protein